MPCRDMSGHAGAAPPSPSSDGSHKDSAGSSAFKSQSGHSIPDVHDMTLLEESRAMIAKQKAQ